MKAHGKAGERTEHRLLRTAHQCQEHDHSHSSVRISDPRASVTDQVSVTFSCALQERSLCSVLFLADLRTMNSTFALAVRSMADSSHVKNRVAVFLKYSSSRVFKKRYHLKTA